MVLMCEIGIGEGKPQVEGYAAGELAASAERVVPGLGPLAQMLAELAGGVAGPGVAGMSFEQLERRVVAGSGSWGWRCCSMRWMRGRPRRCGWRG